MSADPDHPAGQGIQALPNGFGVHELGDLATYTGVALHAAEAIFEPS